jgi:hypothetical protein
LEWLLISCPLEHGTLDTLLAEHKINSAELYGASTASVLARARFLWGNSNP